MKVLDRHPASSVSIAGRYHELNDDWFKLSYLPYSQSARFGSETAERNKSYASSQVALFAALMPSIMPAMVAEARLDCKVAALRVVEAIRMHLAANPGGLPKSLDEITIVPIPNDPMTGKPEWGLHSMQYDPTSDSYGGQSVFDVYSKSTGTALDGTKYSEW